MAYTRRYTKRRRLTTPRRSYARVSRTPKKYYKKRSYSRKTGIEWLDQPDYSGATYKKDSPLHNINKPKDIVLEMPMSQLIPIATKSAKVTNTTTKVENAALKASKTPSKPQNPEDVDITKPGGWEKALALQKIKDDLARKDPNRRIIDTTSDMAETDSLNRTLMVAHETAGTIGSLAVGVPVSVSKAIAAGAGKLAGRFLTSPTTKTIIGSAAQLAGKVMNSPLITKIGGAISKAKSTISPANKSRIYEAAEQLYKRTPVKPFSTTLKTPTGPRTYSYYGRLSNKKQPQRSPPILGKPAYPGSPASPYKPPEFYQPPNNPPWQLPQTDYSTMSSGVRQRNVYPKSPYPLNSDGSLKEGLKYTKDGRIVFKTG